MRKVKKDLAQKPASLSRPDLLDLLMAIKQNKKLIDSDIYRGKIKNEKNETVREEVVEALEAIYYGKCAYCEQYTHTYIEHYRPKNRVNKTPKHGGYFWLCYEWSNLLPTCHECNKIGGGKGDQFPIQNEAKRTNFTHCFQNSQIDFTKLIANHSPLIDENPYLLHPEIDEPSEYLSFEIDEKKRGIALKGLDKTNKRGDQTIRICNLNREELLRKRQETVVFSVLNSIRRAFAKWSKKTISGTQFLDEVKLIFEDLERDSKDEKLSFTLLRKKLISNIENFNSLIISQLPKNQQQIIQLSFESYFNS
jgi:uncharacterized protein (TIGR02646 family)